MIKVQGARDISDRDGHMRRMCDTDERMSNAGMLPCDAFHASQQAFQAMRRLRPRANLARKRGLSNPIIPDRSAHGDGATLPHSGFVQWTMLRGSGRVPGRNTSLNPARFDSALLFDAKNALQARSYALDTAGDKMQKALWCSSVMQPLHHVSRHFIG